MANIWEEVKHISGGHSREKLFPVDQSPHFLEQRDDTLVLGAPTSSLSTGSPRTTFLSSRKTWTGRRKECKLALRVVILRPPRLLLSFRA